MGVVPALAVATRRLAARCTDLAIVAAFLAVPCAMVHPSVLNFGGGTEIVFVWVPDPHGARTG